MHTRDTFLHKFVLKLLLTEPTKNARGMFKKGKSALTALIKDRAEEAKK